ncbi:MAG: helix-turn-helix domain-containing protein [Mesorhizobium sp.]|nr:helix-turn-helix domain-containing protein [Mesorhizobium sp. M1A.F.Ca.IN.022.04.1.1]RWG27097.1 MAG: helix-turn-helix domain-containing protein [Mesorhizobium sp.]TIS14192.1 MAG: helix-turn-helix domain-containing protein [Mesorhizobium sp.]
MRDTVAWSTPISAASCCWLKPRASRNAFTRPESKSLSVMVNKLCKTHTNCQCPLHSEICDLHRLMTKDQVAERLQIARRAAGFTDAAEAAAALGVAYPTYAAHENASRGIRPEAAAKYARRYKVSLDWLLEGRGAGPTQRAVTSETLEPRMVQVKGFVQAGAWAETWEWSDDEVYSVPVPDDPALRAFGLHAAETRGPSMNKRYPEKTVLVFTDLIETGAQLELGRRYIVERERADGMREATVKTLWRDDGGKIWLLPESDDPRFQEPIPIDGGEDDNVRVVGRVVYAVSKE